ncbi:MAG: DUF6115 domain-containing protein [Thermincolia bacterium]
MEYLLFFAGVTLVALGFLMEHPRFKEKVTNPMVARGWAIEEQRINDLKQNIVNAREDVASLLVELERASETVVYSMEEKIKELNALQTSATQVPDNTFSDKVSPSPLSEKNQAKALEHLVEAKKSTRTRKITGIRSANQQGKGQGAPLKNEITSQEKEPASRHAMIHKLAQQGHSVNEIARLMQMGQGEIELILGLPSRGE